MSEILLAIVPIPRREPGNFSTLMRNFLDSVAVGSGTRALVILEGKSNSSRVIGYAKLWRTELLCRSKSSCEEDLVGVCSRAWTGVDSLQFGNPHKHTRHGLGTKRLFSLCGDQDKTGGIITGSFWRNVMLATERYNWFSSDLLEILPAAVYVCDADGVLVAYNRRATELWGRTPKIGWHRLEKP
jgi:PAS domain-containing protein